MKNSWTDKDQAQLGKFIESLKYRTSDLNKHYDHHLKYRRWCVRNKGVCLAEINKYLIENYGIDITKNYGIPEDFRMADLPNGIETRVKDAQLNPMPFDQKFYEKLMACTKIRISRTDVRDAKSKAVFKNLSTRKSESDTEVMVNWLAGNVDGQLVLFKEIISYPIDGVLYEQTVSRPGFPNVAGCYELKAILGGSGQHICELVRSEYNPLSPHRNFMGGDVVLDEPESIYGSHAHIVKDSYNVAFPTLFVHGEAEYMDIENGGRRLTLAQVLFAHRYALNIRPRMSQKDYIAEENVKLSTVMPEVPTGMEKGTFSDRLRMNIEKQKESYDKFKTIPIGDVAKFSEKVYKPREQRLEKGE
ncbi:MAG: hypothetical protein E7361_03255 [Clostridiales bacterium]|nr:hypothetical protein [Clostridiales bacterium]